MGDDKQSRNTRDLSFKAYRETRTSDHGRSTAGIEIKTKVYCVD